MQQGNMQVDIDGKTDTKVLEQAITDRYSVYRGDCFETIRGLPSDTIGLTVTSPPFPAMYVYNDSPRDLGNNLKGDAFLEHFSYLVAELLRVTQPGRSCLIHLTQTPLFKGKDDVVGLLDFRGDTIRLFQQIGWIYYGEITIDKNPQVKASRTKEHSLLFQTLSSDSSSCRVAMADYLIHFKKPGQNIVPIKAGTHQKWSSGGGWITPEEWILWARPCWYGERWYSEQEWLEYVNASKHIPERAMPMNLVWFGADWNPLNAIGAGIRETDVLNVSLAREAKDERHLCPLQLHLIERCIKLWSNPGEIVLDPFSGIGSTGYQALRFKRKYVGFELKKSYYDTSIRNLELALDESAQLSLLDLLPATEEETNILCAGASDDRDRTDRTDYLIGLESGIPAQIASEISSTAILNAVATSSQFDSLNSNHNPKIRLFKVTLETYNELRSRITDDVLKVLDRKISESERVYLVLSDKHLLLSSRVVLTCEDGSNDSKLNPSRNVELKDPSLLIDVATPVFDLFKTFQANQHYVWFTRKKYLVVSIEPFEG